MAADGYVTIHRTTDAAQGELLAETLRSEGIDVRFNRVSSALIGVPSLMIEMTLDVPAKSEARARELLRDLEYVGASDRTEQGEAVEPVEPDERFERGEEDGAGHTAGGNPAASGRDRAGSLRTGRSPILAPGFAFVLPGGAHLYARRPWTSLVLALGLVLCFVTGVASAALGVALAIGIALVLCDAAGGLRAARAESRGVKASRGRQLVAGLGLCGVAVVLGGGAQLVTAGARDRQVARYKVSCTGASLVVENHSGEARVVQLANLRLYATSLDGDHGYDIGKSGSGILHLAPGGRGVVQASIADWLDRSCGFGFAPPRPKDSAFGSPEALDAIEPHASACRLSFDFFAREESAGESRGLEASGRCVPPKGTAQESAGTLEPRR